MVIRFSISIDRKLLDKFDKEIKKHFYSNRSEAIRDLIREYLSKQEWIKGKEVAGCIVLVYDHHKRELVNTLIDIQHNYHDVILATQHIHLDKHNCLEIIAVKGEPERIIKLKDRLKAEKGVKFTSLTSATTGKDLI